MKMHTLIACLAVISLSGCATGCREACLLGFGPGNAAFDAVANHYDTTDTCQYKGKPAGYTLPSYCGHNKIKYRITDRTGRTVGYIK